MTRCPYLSKAGDSVCRGRLLVDTQDSERGERTLSCPSCGRSITQEKGLLGWKTVKVEHEQMTTHA